MNLLLNASIIAGSLFLLNVADPAKANIIDPFATTAPDSNLILAAHEGHGSGGHGGGYGGGHGDGGHYGGGGHGGNWGGHRGGYGYGDVDIGIGISDDNDDCWTDGYGNTQCNYDD